MFLGVLMGCHPGRMASTKIGKMLDWIRYIFSNNAAKKLKNVEF